MNNYNDDSVYKYFELNIKNESSKIIYKLKKELEEIKSSAINNIQNDLDDSRKLILGAKKKSLNNTHQTKLINLKHEFNLKLMEKRTTLVNDLLDELLSKLIKYSKTDEYKNMLKAIINKNENNIAYIEANSKNYLADFEIKINKEILGGINIVLNNNVEIDLTFNTKLEDAKQWFFENSNLFVLEE